MNRGIGFSLSSLGMAVGIWLLSGQGALSSPAEKDNTLFRSDYLAVEPDKKVEGWYVPFLVPDRAKLSTMILQSPFGANRNSYIRGHKHSGADIVPRQKTTTHVGVYPVASGAVCSIHLAAPHLTVVLKHQKPNGKIIYSSYKHLAEVFVKPGDQVGPDDKIARLYTRAEAKQLGGNYDHLHLEIRKNFDDYGQASFSTMSRRELEMRFFDPWRFLKARLHRG